MPVFIDKGAGTSLPPLDNPATAAQIMAGYQALAADGSVLDGTAPEMYCGMVNVVFADYENRVWTEVIL